MLTKINNQEKKYQLQRFNIKRDKNLEFDFRDFKSLKRNLLLEVVDRQDTSHTKGICWSISCIRKIQTNKT